MLFVLFQAAFDPTTAGDGGGIAGVVQRALVLVVLSSVSAVVVGVAGRPRPGTTADARADLLLR